VDALRRTCLPKMGTELTAIGDLRERLPVLIAA
jgi:hypothetical protein